MPSVTLPNWTSHLTGSGPEQHGETDNKWTMKEHRLPPAVQDSEGYYPSVFSVLKEAVPHIKTAFYYNWKALIYPYNRRYIDEAVFQSNRGYAENYDKAFDFIVENRNNPTLVFLYTVHTDSAGHKNTWLSAEYFKAIEETDVVIGKFLDKMKAEDLYNDTYFIFMSDHGGIEHGYGGVSTNEMIVHWGIAGPKIKKGIKLEKPF